MFTERFLTIPLFYYFVILTFLISKLPFVGKFFNCINTGLHEFGHALMALILDGKVLRIEFFNDSSGTTTTQSVGKFRAFLIAIAGYPFATTIAYCCFYLLSIGYDKHVILFLSILFFLMLLFWVRNTYGIIWILIFCLINVGILYLDHDKVTGIFALFYATAIATESLFSTFVQLYLSIKSPKNAGDAANLKKMTGIPGFLWALLFTGYAGFVFYKIILIVGF